MVPARSWLGQVRASPHYCIVVLVDLVLVVIRFILLKMRWPWNRDTAGCRMQDFAPRVRLPLRALQAAAEFRLPPGSGMPNSGTAHAPVFLKFY